MKKEHKELIKEIKDLYEKENNEGAVQAYADYLNRYNSLPQEVVKEIIDFCNECLKDKEDKAILRLRGIAYYNLKNYKQALADYTRAIELNPKYVLAYWNRGNTYYNLKNYKQAIADYTQAIELDSEYAPAYNNRGIVYYNLKNYEQALADYNQAIELDSEYAQAYCNRGIAYSKLKKDEQALADYTRAITLDLEFAPAYNNRGIVYSNLKNYEQALADYNQAIELDSEYAQAYNNRGNIYYNLKNYEQTLSDYNQAIELDPEYAPAYNNRGNIYYNLKNYEQALADYNRAITVDPEYALAYNNRGNIYSNLKNYEQAITDYNQAIEIDSEYAPAYYNRGIAYSNLKKDEQALANYNRAIELYPEDAWYYYSRAGVYEEQKEFDKAISDYKEYIKLESEDNYFYKRAKENIQELEKVMADTLFKEAKESVDAIKELLYYEKTEVVHYTSLTTARILVHAKERENGKPKSASLRISEGNFLNDTSEGDKLPTYLYWGVDEQSKHIESESFHKKPFVGSFVHGDMYNNLTLWRMYGKEANLEGEGCALVMDSNLFLEEVKTKLFTKKEEEKKTISQENKADIDPKEDAGYESEGKMSYDIKEDFCFYHIAYISLNDDGEIKNCYIPEKEDKREKLEGLLKKLKQTVNKANKKSALSSDIKEYISQIQYLFKGCEYQHENEIRLVTKGIGLDPQFTTDPPKVYIVLAPVIGALKRIVLGPKVQKAEEEAGLFYYSLKEQLREKNIPKIEISKLPFK